MSTTSKSRGRPYAASGGLETEVVCGLDACAWFSVGVERDKRREIPLLAVCDLNSVPTDAHVGFDRAGILSTRRCNPDFRKAVVTLRTGRDEGWVGGLPSFKVRPVYVYGSGAPTLGPILMMSRAHRQPLTEAGLVLHVVRSGLVPMLTVLAMPSKFKFEPGPPSRPASRARPLGARNAVGKRPSYLGLMPVNNTFQIPDRLVHLWVAYPSSNLVRRGNMGNLHINRGGDIPGAFEEIADIAHLLAGGRHQWEVRT